MKNKVLKIGVLLVTLFVMLATVSMAAEIPPINYGAQGTEGISKAGSNIAGIIATAGVAIALGVLIWLAIKYITAAPSDKADIKKSAVAYIIGAVLLFAASGVLALIQSFGQQLGNDIG